MGGCHVGQLDFIYQLVILSTKKKKRGSGKPQRKRRPKRSFIQRFLRRIKRGWRKVIRALRRHLALWLVGLLIVAGVFVMNRDWFKPQRSTIVSTDYNGIDVSKHQGNINWKKVAANPKVQFVYIKATEGASLIDVNYHRNLAGARSAGIKAGSYHFFTSYKSPQAQFENFRRHVDKHKQDLLPMVDVEEAGNRYTTRDNLQKRLSTFMELVKKEYGEYPVLYSQYKFYNTMLAPEFNRYIVFIARYGSSEPKLRGKGTYNIWQYSETGRIDGISECVDLDRFANGTSLNDILY